MSTFFQDAFNGLVNTTLETHTPDTGTSWLLKVGASSAYLDGSGHLTGPLGGSFSTYQANGAPGTTDYFAQVDDLQAANTYYPCVHQDAGATNFYYIKNAAGKYAIYKRVAGADTFMGQGAALANQTSVRLVAASNGAGGVILTVYAGAAGSTLTSQFTVTDHVGDNWGGVAPFATAGFAGLIRFNSATNQTADNFISGTGSSPAVVAGAISVSTPTGIDTTTVRLTAAAATGGTGPYTYQWYRGLVPGAAVTAMTLLTGQTTLNLVDTPPDGQIYYYRIRATDNVSATADSATFGAEQWSGRIIVGYIGDSNFHAPGPDGLIENAPAKITRNMKKIAGERTVTGVEMAVSGSTSGSWISGSANYNAAVAAFASAGVTDVLFMIGTNDAGSVSQATYQANVLNTTQALNTAGYRVFLCYQIAIQSPQDQTRNQALLLYQQSLATIAATSPTQIKVIGQDAYKYTFSHPEEYNYDPAATPGIHMLDRGYESMALIFSRDYGNVLAPPSSGAAGGSFAWAA